MKNLTVEVTDDGTGVYVAVDPRRPWGATTQPDDLITLDWNDLGGLSGIQLIGSPAKSVARALMEALSGLPAQNAGDLKAALNECWEEEGA